MKNEVFFGNDQKIKCLKEENRARLSELLNQAFETSYYFQDFPVWDPCFHPSEKIERWGWFEASELVACVCLRIATLQGFRVGVLGAVATHLRWRHQGLATQLIHHALERLQKSEVEAIVLWGSGASFYAQWGFQPFGVQYRVFLNSGLPFFSSFSGDIQEGWVPGIFDCRRNKKEGFLLHPSDQAWFIAHSRVRWFYTGSPLCPDAYVGYERGIDLQGLVHEWGGSPDALKILLAELVSRFPQAQLLCSPAQLKTSLPFLEGFSGVEEILCLAKVLRPSFLVLLGEAGIRTQKLWFWGLDSA